MKYTLVKHPFHTAQDGHHYEQCVAVKPVGPLGQMKVRRAGGLLFDSSERAEAVATAENYGAQDERNKRDGLELMVSLGINMFDAKAPGSFSSVTIDGLPVYIPAT
ncbi:hypothetical protein [Streptomyces sp. 5-10]|uniref:hypothetical protein n=1 Tax=Streptomyces sp. 5-10 TaxID=878925 RepID=UPI00168AA486|nr:hypothetical protein [Streptomyces sp. 5-10]MBD3004611.1 hypothetical protein [Streptomyces sp. 5-10]